MLHSSSQKEHFWVPFLDFRASFEAKNIYPLWRTLHKPAGCGPTGRPPVRSGSSSDSPRGTTFRWPFWSRTRSTRPHWFLDVRLRAGWFASICISTPFWALCLTALPICYLLAVFLVPQGGLFGGMESEICVQIALPYKSLQRLLWRSLLVLTICTFRWWLNDG